ncbi:MAG: SusC/RagA family TonB-linked outer membrane protein [Candidatus Pedobacter colombiensis]|uniref:SusC/RagA family TonB-linked outer membrane protein n=1 Tax=Candidatus Pedobacter colombiensis TaxID=3121371 RepID=A0AAJ6B7D6_9SPHI|nr:SusC/RagA family TonB-linked outer membrane protein [Pedobacter sp.]WEK19396.1 MAG: SusC/RagA family TonB-linked outer membrane protein [Pedobacter sp.]
MKKLLQGLFILMFIAGAAMAQDRTITGTVTGKDDGLPIPGISVKIIGTTIGTSTDANGKYAVKLASQSASLEFSSIGYLKQVIAVGSSNVINVVLVTDAKELGEVVVTANAIVREKRTIGYSAPTVKSDELTQGGSPSALSSLAGKVAGVNISSTSGSPGSSARVVLRGGSSISGSNQALIVVDGMPIDNSSVIGGLAAAGGGASPLSSVDFGNRGNDLNPDDIESVTVLKGPAAAALYGSRASNGALVITTKSGTQNASKTSITFNSNNTFSSVLKLPELQQEYGQGDGGVSILKENGSWGPALTGIVQPWGQQIDGVRQMKPFSAVPNNIRNFFETGYAADNNLSFSGGGEKTSFYLGLSSLNSDGIFPGNYDYYNKYGVRFNGKTEFSNKFSAGVSFNYNRIDANEVAGGQGGSSVYNNVLQTPIDIDFRSLKDLNNKYNGYGITTDDGVFHPNNYGYYGAYTTNPYWILQNYSNLDNVSRVTGNFNLGYKPYSWLNVQERVGIDTYNDRRRILAPKYNYSPIDTTPAYAGTTPRTNVGSYEIDEYNVMELAHDLMITATYKFNDDFSGSLMIGNNIRQRSTTSMNSATNGTGGLVVPGWYNLSNSNGPVNIALDNLSKRRLVGLYADLNLAYKTYLFLEATARNDWSSTLPVQNNSFFYPSVSGSFVFSELLKASSTADWLTYGKLRSSWAQVGSDTDPYQLLSTFSKATVNGSFGSTVFPFGSVAALMASSGIGNLNLMPEKTSSFEVGTELGFLDSRISADFSYYRNSSKNQILNIPIPNSTGFGTSLVNAGEIRNNGVELSLRGTVVKSTNITWELYGTYTKNNSMVVSLLPGVNQVSLGGFGGMTVTAAKGYAYGQFYAVTNQTDAEGRTIISPTTGRPINTTTAQYLGSYNPKYQASFGTNFKFKQINFGVLFDVKQGGKFSSRTKSITDFAGTAAETGGVRFGAIFPNSVYLDANGNSVVNTTYTYNKEDYFGNTIPGVNIIDASYVKVRSATLSYQFSKDQLRGTPFGVLVIGLYGNNLFLWAAKENKYADPEVNSAGSTNLQGFDFTAQPAVRNYGINLKVSF